MKKALVLSGGGSLGAYEMGAWKYFREKGISFDIVTGTSIGAINGAVYVSGDYDKAMHLWNTVTATDVFEHGFSITENPLKSFWNLSSSELYRLFKSYIKQHGVNIEPFMELVKQTIDPHKVKESPITLGIVVTLYKGKKELDLIMQEQPVELILDYIHASSACWPIFPIYKIGDTKYIDGGYTNNLPVDFAFKLGADEVTAIVLKAIPQEPQFPHFLTLPNVKTIRASRDTGSIMDFTREVIDRNMMLGYLDTRKAYDDAWGYEYTFDKDKLTEDVAKAVYMKTLKETPREFEQYRQEFSFKGKKPATYLDYYLRGIEIMGSWLGIDYLKSYKIKSFENFIIEILHKTASEKGFSQKAIQVKAHTEFKKMNKKDLLALLYRSVKKGSFSSSLVSIIEQRKSLHYFVEILSYWKEKGRLY